MATKSADAARGGGGHETLDLPLRDLYLDPNNFRFADHRDYTSVPEQNVTEANVQKRTLNIVLGDGNEGVQDLLDSFRKSGWLPVDQIQVRPLSEGRFLVIETLSGSSDGFPGMKPKRETLLEGSQRSPRVLRSGTSRISSTTPRRSTASTGRTA
jgi:hypothetical protein